MRPAMQIALVGTGQMGQAVASLAPEHGHEIAERFNADRPLTSADAVSADVAIDFSLPDVALDHLRWYCEHELPAVVGTTGWYEELPTVRSWVEDAGATLLYAPNFSIGVAVLRRAVSSVAPLLNQLPDYDAFVHEMHHTNKVDSPSGTARMLGEVLLEALDRKTHLDAEAQHDRIDPAALHVSSTRAGSVFGEHTVGFDSDYDRISLEHRAKSRHGFAFGAVRAAEWLDGRTGLFTLEDVIDDWIGDAS
jgi:4-hydroxy-tetrahydrodipicolinate reductase